MPLTEKDTARLEALQAEMGLKLPARSEFTDLVKAEQEREAASAEFNRIDAELDEDASTGRRMPSGKRMKLLEARQQARARIQRTGEMVRLQSARANDAAIVRLKEFRKRMAEKVATAIMTILHGNADEALVARFVKQADLPIAGGLGPDLSLLAGGQFDPLNANATARQVLLKAEQAFGVCVGELPTTN